MSIMGLPLILFQVEGEDMGDLEYLSRIANGELTGAVLKNFQNLATTIGEITFETVPAGKDWYLMGWSFISVGASNASVTLEFPDGTTVEIGDARSVNPWVYPGIAKGNKAVADDLIKLTRGGTAAANVVNMFILEVTAGTSPKLT